jgi:hypothetical protein
LHLPSVSLSLKQKRRAAMLGRKKREAWVFVKGGGETPPSGVVVELVERRQTRRAGPDGGSGGPYAWAIFPETPFGAYTVRVIYPDGRRAQARLTIDAGSNSVTLDESSVREQEQ